MNPLFYLRIGGALIAAAAVWWIWHTVSGWREDAARLRVVEQEYSTYRTQAEAEAERQGELIKADESARLAMTQSITGVRDALADLARRPINQVTYHETQQADGTVCPDPRISAEWFGVYNATADAANRAAQ